MKRMIMGLSVALACALGCGCTKTVREDPADEPSVVLEESAVPIEDRLVTNEDLAEAPTIAEPAREIAPADTAAAVTPPPSPPVEITPATPPAAPLSPPVAPVAAEREPARLVRAEPVATRPAASKPAAVPLRPIVPAPVSASTAAPRTVALQTRPAPVPAVPQPAPKAPAPIGTVFVAGDTFSLEQAFADATLEKLGGASGFTIVATQREAAKLTEKGAKPGVKTAVRQFQQAGGHFYLCDRDLAAARLAAKDVLPGVKVERALTKQEQQATSAQDAELRRVRRACS